MVAHEMRNPLNAITQCAEEGLSLLGDLKSMEEVPVGMDHAISSCAEAIDTILYCARHQTQIIDDVLTVSKLDSDLLSIAPTVSTPISIVKQVEKMYANQIRASNISISIEVSSTYKDYASGLMIDPSRILQILINLMGNAIKFMKDQHLRRLTVFLGTSQQKPSAVEVHYVPSGRVRTDPTLSPKWGTGEDVYLYFAVRDTGPGLTDQEMESLFARFRQASPRTHVQYGGSGLGLFISRELAELHGGEIGIASTPGQGSTFAFYVKGRRPDRQQPVAGSECPVEGTHGISTAPSFSGSTAVPENIGAGVLVVEDNLVNQKVLNRQLAKLGYRTMTANHGREALSILQTSSWWLGESPPGKEKEQLSIILCDLEMPVMDGKTCVRQIRAWQQEGLLYAYIPVIAVTGNARLEQILSAREAGFDDVLCKPYSVLELLPRIKAFTAKSAEMTQP